MPNAEQPDLLGNEIALGDTGRLPSWKFEIADGLTQQAGVDPAGHAHGAACRRRRARLATDPINEIGDKDRHTAGLGPVGAPGIESDADMTAGLCCCRGDEGRPVGGQQRGFAVTRR